MFWIGGTGPWYSSYYNPRRTFVGNRYPFEPGRTLWLVEVRWDPDSHLWCRDGSSRGFGYNLWRFLCSSKKFGVFPSWRHFQCAVTHAIVPKTTNVATDVEQTIINPKYLLSNSIFRTSSIFTCVWRWCRLATYAFIPSNTRSPQYLELRIVPMSQVRWHIMDHQRHTQISRRCLLPSVRRTAFARRLHELAKSICNIWWSVVWTLKKFRTLHLSDFYTNQGFSRIATLRLGALNPSTLYNIYMFLLKITMVRNI